MCFGSIFGGGNKSADRIAEQQRADEAARQARITSGMSGIASSFSGFNDDYYAKRAKDFVDFATPTLEKQTKDAHDALIYGLSRTGNLDSSAAIKKNADLTAESDAQRVGIADQGLNYANQARTQVENTRGNIVAELNATGDDSAAANSALRQSQNLNMPIGYSPLGNLFSTFLNGVGSIGSNAGNGYSGFLGNGGGAGLFSPSSSSSRVVR